MCVPSPPLPTHSPDLPCGGLYTLFESEDTRSPLLDQRLVATGLLSSSPLVPHIKKLGPFYAPVLLRCSTCRYLGSLSCLSRHLPSLRTTAPRSPRLRSLVCIVSLPRTSPLPAYLPRFCVRCCRSQSRVQTILLRSLGPVRQQLPPSTAACDAACERHQGPGHVGQNLVQHTNEHSAQGAALREHHRHDLRLGERPGLL